MEAATPSLLRLMFAAGRVLPFYPFGGFFLPRDIWFQQIAFAQEPKRVLLSPAEARVYIAAQPSVTFRFSNTNRGVSVDLIYHHAIR